jgi:dihydrofolate reductase
VSKLIYVANTSLDGYIEDVTGAFDWGHSEDVHPFAVELLRPVGTFLYGRRLYETMTYWDAPVETYPPGYREFARAWQKPDKIVFSRTLTSATTSKTQIERTFDPEAIRSLKADSGADITIGGAEIAALALDAQLVDECVLLLHPVILGAGKPAFHTGKRLHFELLETHRIGTDVIYLRYRIEN